MPLRAVSELSPTLTNKVEVDIILVTVHDTSAVEYLGLSRSFEAVREITMKKFFRSRLVNSKSIIRR